MDRNSPCALQDFVPFGAAAQKGEEEKRNYDFFLTAISRFYGGKTTLEVLMKVLVRQFDRPMITPNVWAHSLSLLGK